MKVTNSDTLGITVLFTEGKPLDLRVHCLHPAEVRMTDFHAICKCFTKLHYLLMPITVLGEEQLFQLIEGGYNLHAFALEAS